MIKYKFRCKSIYCSKRDEFEAWFQNIESYEKQKKLGLLSCPTCGAEDVIKLLTTPNLNKLSNGILDNNKEQNNLNVSEKSQDLQQKLNLKNITAFLRTLKKEVQKNSTYVGNEFVEQARSMNQGKIEEKPIHGHGTQKDIEELREEGINILNIPWVADDH